MTDRIADLLQKPPVMGSQPTGVASMATPGAVPPPGAAASVTAAPGPIPPDDPMHPDIKEEIKPGVAAPSAVSEVLSKAKLAGGETVTFATEGIYLMHSTTKVVYPFLSDFATHPDAIVVCGSFAKSKGYSNAKINPSVEKASNADGIVVPVQLALEKFRKGFYFEPESSPDEVAPNTDIMSNFQVDI